MALAEDMGMSCSDIVLDNDLAWALGEAWVTLTDDEVNNFWGPGKGLGRYAGLIWRRREGERVPGLGGGYGGDFFKLEKHSPSVNEN